MSADYYDAIHHLKIKLLTLHLNPAFSKADITSLTTSSISSLFFPCIIISAIPPFSEPLVSQDVSSLILADANLHCRIDESILLTQATHPIVGQFNLSFAEIGSDVL